MNTKTLATKTQASRLDALDQESAERLPIASRTRGGDAQVGSVLTLPAARVKFPAMPGAYEVVAIHEAIGEQAAIVRAPVGHDHRRAILQHAHRDFLARSLCRQHRAPRALRDSLGNGQAFWFGRRAHKVRPLRTWRRGQDIFSAQIGDLVAYAEIGHGRTLPAASDIRAWRGIHASTRSSSK